MSNPDRIILSELNPVQKQLLAMAAKRATDLRVATEKAVSEYKQLIAMAMPPGANGFDDVQGVFFYEEPKAPEPQLDLVEDEPEQDETEE
jgi:hypothetical protein